MNLFQAALPLLSISIILFLGGIVLARKPGSRVNRAFFAFVIAAVFWILSVFLSDSANIRAMALVWARLAIVGPIFVPAILLYFSFVFPQDKPMHNRWLSFFIFIPSLALLFFVPTPYNVESVSLQAWGTDFEPGPLYVALFVYFILYGIIAAGVLFRHYQLGNRIERVQIIYVLSGLITAVAIGITTNLVLPLFGEARSSVFGPSVTIIPLVGFTVYAILKHHLFNIRVIATEIFTALLVLTMFFNIFSYKTAPELIFRSALFLGSLVFGLFLIKSVLDEIQAREELALAYEKLKELDKAKSEFISIASHQLRTPLTAIKGYVSMILEGTYGRLTKKLEAPVRSVADSNDRLIKLVNNLLNISRIESGKIKMEWENVNVKEVGESVQKELGGKMREKNIAFKMEESSIGDYVIRADREKVRNILMNVIDNAIRYTSEGTITMAIKRAEGDMLRMEIRDTGEGMTKEEITGLFESFTRGKAGQRLWTEGAGLGLYIAKKFTDMHGGRIWAESAGKGKGSAFIVELSRTGINPEW